MSNEFESKISELNQFKIVNSIIEKEFLCREEGIAFIKKKCPNVITKLYKRCGDKWVYVGSTW